MKKYISILAVLIFSLTFTTSCKPEKEKTIEVEVKEDKTIKESVEEVGDEVEDAVDKIKKEF